MKALVAVLFLTMLTSAFAAPFSPEELLGTYTSADRKAAVRIYKEMTKAPTLFEPAVFQYYTDIEFDAGPCMLMYGGDRKVNSLRGTFSYNGSWLPKTEYLSSSFGEDGDNDGQVYVDSVDLKFSKTHASGKSSVQMSLSFNLTHNPDGGDGEDGGVANFESCSKKTLTGWSNFKKIK